jgi:hypothetical protein
MTPNIAYVILFCLLQLPSQLRVELVFNGRAVKPRVAAAMMCEVRRIWSPYHVDVSAVAAKDSGRDSAIVLSITLVDGDTSGVVYTLGVTQFVGAEPTRSILIYPNAISALLSSEGLVVRDCVRVAMSCEDTVFGRVMGRALAHEIGHYLLRSRGHAVAGLMRARPSAETLVELDSPAFGLSPGEQGLLVPRRIQARR